MATRAAREGASPEPEAGREEGAETTSWLEDARVGLRFVWSTNGLRGIITMNALLIAMTMAPIVVLTPYIVVSRFGSDQLLGVIWAAEGVGAVAGGAIASVRRFNRQGGLALVALVPVPVICFVLALRVPIGVILPLFTIVGAGQAFFGVIWMSAVQSRVPEDRLGRVMSVDWVLSTSLLPLGMALTAPLSAAVGIDPFLVAAGAVGLFVLSARIAQPALRQFGVAAPAPAAGEEADGGFSVRRTLARMDNEALLTFALPLTPAGTGDVTVASDGLRRVERADADAVGDLYWHAHPPGIAASDPDDAVADIHAIFDGEYGVFWSEGSFVVEVDGAVIGVALTAWRAPWPGTPDGPFVVELFTDPGSRRRGHAKQLLAAVATAASAAGEDVIGLRVAAGNSPALNLYRSFGFHIHEI